MTDQLSTVVSKSNLSIELQTPNTNGNLGRGIEITHLSKMRCRENVLKEIQSNVAITDRFKLNIVRLNRWWWSVVFIDRSGEI